MKQEQKKIDVINRLLEDCVLAFPVSSFIIGIYQQYQRKGWLTKKQLEGLYAKAGAIEGMAPEKLASLEAIIRKMPNRHKSDLPAPKPMYQKDESVGKVIDSILAKYPQHKRVLFFRSKYNNKEQLSAAEIAELKKFSTLLKV